MTKVSGKDVADILAKQAARSGKGPEAEGGESLPAGAAVQAWLALKSHG